jgi:SAM-dependent methyltransferase
MTMSGPITPERGYELNRLNWDERVDAHFESPMYQAHVQALSKGGVCVDQVHIDEMGDVRGKSLLHLQCHMGMETLSWARLGAEVTGLDFSQPAIDRASSMAKQFKLPARFVRADLYDTMSAIPEVFDIVFVSVGAICWLADIDGWAQTVAKMLKPGGRLYMNEVHPFTETLDDHPTEPMLVVTNPYFSDVGLEYEADGSYADMDASFTHNRAVNWSHPIGAVINALINSGMTIRSLDESTTCVWPRYRMMEEVNPNQFELPGALRDALPMTYTLQARKDQETG